MQQHCRDVAEGDSPPPQTAAPGPAHGHSSTGPSRGEPGAESCLLSALLTEFHFVSRYLRQEFEILLQLNHIARQPLIKSGNHPVSQELNSTTPVSAALLTAWEEQSPCQMPREREKEGADVGFSHPESRSLACQGFPCLFHCLTPSCTFLRLSSFGGALHLPGQSRLAVHQHVRQQARPRLLSSPRDPSKKKIPPDSN